MIELKPSCCIVYTTDTKYLFPTLVSAMQARRQASRAKADVAIYCVALQPEAEDIFGPVCRREGIALVPVPRSMIDGQTAMMARLFLNCFVPEQYSQYLYLDGDTHVLGSLDPLIDADVPEGRFLAANDPITFLLEDKGRQSKDLLRHMNSLGLSNAQALGYFNSGVLRIHRTGWEKIGERAWEYFKSKPHSRFPDQDALNVVACEERLVMPLAWNFPIFLRNSRLEQEIKPRIEHFMSSPKPWHGAFPPWDREACRPYLDAMATYPELLPYRMVMPAGQRITYHLQQHTKKMMEMILWGPSERRSRILRYEAQCQL